MHKTSSILDYQQPELASSIWKDMSLRKSVETFIYSSIEGFFEMNDISNSYEFIKGIYIGSSLATHFYTRYSDLDIKIIIDLFQFRSYNPQYDHVDDDDLLNSLIDLGRTSVWLTACVPGTYHELDAYFYSTDEFSITTLIKYDSLYSLFEDKWIKKPKKLMNGYSPSIILDIAKNKAEYYINRLSVDVAKAKRDCIDFLVFKDYIKSLDNDDLKNVYKDFESLVESVTQSLEQLVEDRELIKELRKKAFSKKELTTNLEKIMESLNYSDGNLIFKVLQRYGYMRILTEIKILLKNRNISLDTIEDAVDILEDSYVS